MSCDTSRLPIVRIARPGSGTDCTLHQTSSAGRSGSPSAATSGDALARSRCHSAAVVAVIERQIAAAAKQHLRAACRRSAAASAVHRSKNADPPAVSSTGSAANNRSRAQRVARSAIDATKSRIAPPSLPHRRQARRLRNPRRRRAERAAGARDGARHFERLRYGPAAGASAGDAQLDQQRQRARGARLARRARRAARHRRANRRARGARTPGSARRISKHQRIDTGSTTWFAMMHASDAVRLHHRGLMHVRCRDAPCAVGDLAVEQRRRHRRLAVRRDGDVVAARGTRASSGCCVERRGLDHRGGQRDVAGKQIEAPRRDVGRCDLRL